MLALFSYSKAAGERAMKIQEVILRAMARKIAWWQAAEMLGFSDRHLRRIRERYQEFGYEAHRFLREHYIAEFKARFQVRLCAAAAEIWT